MYSLDSMSSTSFSGYLQLKSIQIMLYLIRYEHWSCRHSCRCYVVCVDEKSFVDANFSFSICRALSFGTLLERDRCFLCHWRILWNSCALHHPSGLKLVYPAGNATKIKLLIQMNLWTKFVNTSCVPFAGPSCAFDKYYLSKQIWGSEPIPTYSICQIDDWRCPIRNLDLLNFFMVIGSVWTTAINIYCWLSLRGAVFILVPIPLGCLQNRAMGAQLMLDLKCAGSKKNKLPVSGWSC